MTIFQLNWKKCDFSFLRLKLSQCFMFYSCHRIRTENYLYQFSDSYLEACGRNSRKNQPAKFAVPPCSYFWIGRPYSINAICSSLLLFLATSWLGLAMVSVVRCAGIWTNNKCCLLQWTKSIIALTWLLPFTNITYAMYFRWASEEHVRTGYICWFFCGVKHMLHDVSTE